MATRTKKVAAPEVQTDAARLRAKLQEINEQFWKSKEEGAPKTRAEQLRDAIGEDGFGCIHRTVVRLIEALAGEKLPPPRTAHHHYPTGVVCVPISNPNAHSYRLDDPVVVIQSTEDSSDCVAWQVRSREQGNYLPRPRAAFRDPTKEEITSSLDAFVEWTECHAGRTKLALEQLEATQTGKVSLF